MKIRYIHLSCYKDYVLMCTSGLAVLTTEDITLMYAMLPNSLVSI